MSAAHRAAVAALVALFVLQFAWHAPDPRAGWLGAAVYSLPLLWVGLLVAARRHGAFFWAGVLALPYLCHGIAEAFAVPADRPMAIAEAALAGFLALAVSWDGMRARRAQRRAGKAPAADAQPGRGPTV
jgi:uncharacterized membrane protein